MVLPGSTGWLVLARPARMFLDGKFIGESSTMFDNRFLNALLVQWLIAR